MIDPRYNACDRKLPYDTIEAAEFVLRSMREKGKAHEGLQPYRCPYGDHWHLGRKHKRERQRQRRARRRQMRKAS